MIVGLGTDIIEIVRIGQMVERHGELFLGRVYTDDEVSYCQRRKESYQHFAGRWAAKEAVMKQSQEPVERLVRPAVNAFGAIGARLQKRCAPLGRTRRRAVHGYDFEFRCFRVTAQGRGLFEV